MATDTVTAPTAEQTVIGAWAIGHTLPGALVPSDPAGAFATWSDAVAALGDHARAYADTDDEEYEALDCGHGPDGEDVAEHLSDCLGTMRATVDAILSDQSFGAGSLSTDHGRDWSFWASDSSDARVTFWVRWDATATPDEE